jgi:hypothetical protein
MLYALPISTFVQVLQHYYKKSTNWEDHRVTFSNLLLLEFLMASSAADILKQVVGLPRSGNRQLKGAHHQFLLRSTAWFKPWSPLLYRFSKYILRQPVGLWMGNHTITKVSTMSSAVSSWSSLDGGSAHSMAHATTGQYRTNWRHIHALSGIQINNCSVCSAQDGTELSKHITAQQYMNYITQLCLCIQTQTGQLFSFDNTSVNRPHGTHITNPCIL